MKIALIGATGRVGSRLLAEALRRGHQVTGIVPDPEKLTPARGLTAKRGDVNDETGLAALLAGHEVAISAVRFAQLDPRRLIGAVKRAKVDRLLVVGGAGSLEVAPGVQLVDTEGFPAQFKAEALPGRDFLNLLRAEPELSWTFLSPSALFEPGERTGKFRLGRDRLLVDDKGASRVSMEDLAIAMLDEVETPRHVRARFTVGY
jgi:putative NADH-flavin reductase